MTLTFTDKQREAIEAPFDRSLAITGPNRSGKSTALAARAERFARETGCSPFYAPHPSALVELAHIALNEAGYAVRIVDEIAARRLFTRCAQPLFDLTWELLEDRDVDPEVAALRSPDRFTEAAYRLLRKLRDAAIDPATFLTRSLAGATEFYANPPNLAHAELILATKDAYRDSLAATNDELQRQYRREIDLAKILAGLFETYVEAVDEEPALAPSDAIARAIGVLEKSPHIAAALRERFSHAFVDEIQEATPAQRRLLEAIYGATLPGLTVAGDVRAATSTFRGSRPEIALGKLAVTIELPPLAHETPAFALHRAKTTADEANHIAAYIRDLLGRGVAPGDIAMLFRSSADVHCYTDVLLDRDIPVAVGGDLNIFSDRRALDALALLWNVWDPFRHEWMLRTLAGRALALCDASVATLCSDPPDPQRPLFVVDDEPAPTARSSRWDPKRDVRLGWNVLRGDQDPQLNESARARVARFRELRAHWIAAMIDAPFDTFVRTVWAQGLAVDGTPGSARALAQQHVLQVLLDRLCVLHAARPEATLGDLLDDIAERAEEDDEFCAPPSDTRFVSALSIDAARGRSFAHVIVPDARPGSFPRWYVPDAFLWSPKYGMIPRENVGDAQAARTAKFSYYLHVSKARDAYNAQERRAFEYALSRAHSSVLVTASGSATRGITAPEFLEELRTRR